MILLPAAALGGQDAPESVAAQPFGALESEWKVDFSWTKEQQALRQSVIDFARRELNHDVRKLDYNSEFPRDGWNKCARFGIHGLMIPKEYGGRGADILTTVCALEALGYACEDNGLIFSINAHMWTAEIPFLQFGTEEQKRRYLPKLTSGEFVGIQATTEPTSGSDAFSLRTRADKKGSRYVLNGSKTFISNASVADVVIVNATLDPSKGAAGVTGFIVDKGTPGFTISKKLEKMGLRTSPMAELAFDDCEVPEENILGKVGGGQAIFTISMEWERICIFASHVGAMQRMLEASVNYATTTGKEGRPADVHPEIADKIAEMDVRLETARLALYKAAWLKQQGKRPLREAAIAKLSVSRACIATCLDALQIQGPQGGLTENRLERQFRDAMSGTLYSGTSEIQKSIIARWHGL
ncbi:MAG TPA: acyl-CoA dehydrogenase family protein [Terriglobia bacterium]|nr:acyl-CoA dehydrogenase family protein [Terriglobia bacterium]